MKRKIIIYLMTMAMVLSPVTAFADIAPNSTDENTAPVEDVVSDVPTENVDLPEESVDIPSEDIEVAIENEEVTDSRQDAQITGSESDVYEWTNPSVRTEAKRNDEVAVGIFKAKRYRKGSIAGTSLYYAEPNGYVGKQEKFINVDSGRRYIHDSNA